MKKQFLFLSILLAILLSSCGKECLKLTENQYKKYENIPHNSTWITSSDGYKVYNVYPKEAETIEYKGNSINNIADGEGKVVWYQKGIHSSDYTGQFVQGKYHGQGISHLGKSRYEGQYANGEKNGFGILIDSITMIKYKGNFKDGKKDGPGTFVYPNGDEYSGNMIKNYFSDSAEYRWINGDSYKFSLDYFLGWMDGVYKWANGDTIHLKYYEDRLITKLPQDKVIQKFYFKTQNTDKVKVNVKQIKLYKPECVDMNLSLDTNKIVLMALINEKGQPIKYDIIKSTDKAVEILGIYVVMNSIFEPCYLDGVAVEQWIRFPFLFRKKILD